MGKTTLSTYIQDHAVQYRQASKATRGELLDHVCALYGIHRKHAIRMFARVQETISGTRGRPKYYDRNVLLPPLLSIWKATNQICSKRLVCCMSQWVPCYRSADGVPLPFDVQEALMALSAATMDRMLARYRRLHGKLGFATTRPGSLLRSQIPIRTNQWDETRPGFIEADTVAHGGGSMAGMFAFTVAVVDIATGWIEHRAVWGKGERGVRASLVEIEEDLPFRIRGFDCDNGGEFLNHHLVRHFLNRKNPVAFTRSRPYRSNDNAHIEEKNWTKVRQYLGYARFDNPAIVPLLNDLYKNEWRLFHNFCLPSFKLIEKRRVGGRIQKIHDEPKTPCERLLEHPDIPASTKKKLRARRAALDPFLLQESIKKKIKEILSLATFEG
jgi:hypothetical protein